VLELASLKSFIELGREHQTARILWLFLAFIR